jgi:hypothetical protein
MEAAGTHATAAATEATTATASSGKGIIRDEARGN